MRAVTRLIDKGYEAYLVGGCVRDLLLGRTPKDYDIATEARPPQVKRTFSRNCRIIGRRFKLAHLHFHRNTKILECSTFRRMPQADEGDEDLLITRDNDFGNAEEDALRRDFTINALFLDPTEDKIVDHVDGLADIDAKVIRTIGDPAVRFREDPVRILRAAKFAGRLGFDVEPDTLAAMKETAEDLVRAAAPRVLEEILRLLRSGHATDSFRLLHEVRAIGFLVPTVGEFLAEAGSAQIDAFWALLGALDVHVQSQPPGAEPPPNGVLLAALLFEAVVAARQHHPKRSASSVAEDLLGSLTVNLRLPRRDSGCLKRACGVQHRFSQPADKRRFRLESFVHSPYFEESLLLFELRVRAAGEGLDALEPWLKLRASSRPAEEAAEEHVSENEPERAASKRRRRRRRRRVDSDEQPGADDNGQAAEPQPAAADFPETSGERPAKKRRKPRKKPAEPSGTADDDEDLSDVTFPSGDASLNAAPERADDVADAADAEDAAGEELTLSNVTLEDVTFDDDEKDDQDDDRPRRKRRRRGRRGRSGSRAEEDADQRDGADDDEGRDEAAARRAGKSDRARHQGRNSESRRDRKKRPKKSRGSVRSDVGVVPRYRDRRGKVEVIEPVAQDLSAFDVELDPKRVPTFGSIVEGQKRPKRRGPRLTNKGGDDYRPPPPPGADGAPAAPPPAPRDDDTFGDW